MQTLNGTLKGDEILKGTLQYGRTFKGVEVLFCEFTGCRLSSSALNTKAFKPVQGLEQLWVFRIQG